MKKYRKIIIIVLAIAIFIPVVITIVNLCRTSTLSVLVTPLDSTISINGQTYKNGTYRFFPGVVSVKIEHPDLDTKEYELELKPFSTILLYDYLISDHDFSYYSSHKDDYEALKFVHDEDALEYINHQEAANDITEILPINTLKQSPSGYNRVTIKNASSESKCTSTVCLKITDDSENHSASSNVLEDYGYSIDDYQVFYESE